MNHIPPAYNLQPTARRPSQLPAGSRGPGKTRTSNPIAYSLQPTASRRSRAGFTLIELLVVITVIAILSSIVLAAAWGLFKDQRGKSTQAMLNQVQNAIAESDRVIAKYQDGDGNLHTRFLFDFNGDGILDGRPADDFDAATAAEAAALEPPYRGFVSETQFHVQAQVEERTGRVLDGWVTPLRVRYKPSKDVSGVIVQSAGPDGKWNTPDDLYSGEGGNE